MENNSKVSPNRKAQSRKTLGFMFYPQDWWTSDSFYKLNLEERYTYLECLFFMYLNNGYLNMDREELSSRLRTQVKPKTWKKITQLLTWTDLGYTHPSVKKRRTKAEASRENGKLGGRPKKPTNPAVNLPFKYKIKESKKNLKETVSDGKEIIVASLSEDNIKTNWDQHIKILDQHGIKNTAWYESLMQKCKGASHEDFNQAALDVKTSMLTDLKIHPTLADFKRHIRNVFLNNHQRKNKI